MINKKLTAKQANKLNVILVKNRYMATAQQIRKAYLDYVLTNNEKPKSVYVFVKKLKITETDFYQFFSSFESIEKTIWFELTFETINKIKEQEVWPQYTAREKMLSFFYSYLENLKNERSFVIYSLKNHRGKFSTPDVLAGVKPIFENFAQEIIEEGLDSGELAERRFLSKRYKDALWIQFAFIVNFWINDDSEGFEKSDEAIEKGINVTFDLFQHSPIDNLLEYGKFLSRNGKFAEKMRF
ncbi:TetR family transcriptional regulator C-terminal domain-containing protein [Pedobacter sp. ISL-68]|uniref:TetR family transcriptional regulator C-terminal domain-containing protein n=1 Tax=Pedobacter sp. ISL-68 TaxID=2819165 RepID=UPI00293D9925|nr:TetR family transcriptional regulator C-terminal domain-containing protein [Pedobacter sp. ISL-68]